MEASTPLIETSHIHEQATKNSPGNLQRTIGVFGLSCSVINITVGTGIFVLPALIAEHLGAAAILCYFICGLLIFLIALCFAEVGSKVSNSGGTYAYIETAFGPFAGFLSNYIFWIGSCICADATVANGLSITITHFFPALESAAFRPLFFALLFGGLAWINVRGTKSGLSLIIFTTIAKLIPLILLVVFGLSHIHAANLQWKGAVDINNVGSASLLLFFAFLGIESAVTNSGEFKNPSRVVPLGIFGGLSVVLVLYVLIHLVVQGTLGNELTLYKQAPLAEASKRLFGYVGITIILIGTAVAMLGNLSDELLAVPRVLFAGARNGILPRFLGKVHPKYITPHLAIIAYAVLDYVVALNGAFEQLAILTSASTLFIYLGVELAAIRLRYKKEFKNSAGFVIPGGLVVPILAIIITIWVLSHLSRQEFIVFAASIIILSIVYYLLRMFKK